MEYRDVWMRRVMMQNQRVHALFVILAKDSEDYGRTALRMIFDQLVPSDSEVTRLYQEAAEKDGGMHVSHETSASRMIATLIKLSGWKEFVAGFELHAKNKAAQLRRIGLDVEAEKWDRAALVASKLPKNVL